MIVGDADRDRLVRALRRAGCVFAEDEAALLIDDSADAAQLAALAARRVAGEPLEHILGWARFCGLRIAVADGVFVPRVRTELLVDEALHHLRGLVAPTLLDLCCGVAPIATAVASSDPAVVVVAADLSEAELAVARRNLARFGGRAEVHRGDLFDAVPRGFEGRFDVVAANAPYVPTGEIALMPGEARDHEEPIALDGGLDGLSLHRRIAAGAARWLAPDGVLLIETSERQAEATQALCDASDLRAEIVRDDDRDAVAIRARR